MATRVKTAPHGGAHTAGIYADLSVDGPVIGTLVAIVDRAKNLPNRKTIGKQDPYCAARLGKEAKKTKTDIRGGQTPKWDQELRFTVHDSADYLQLKISVFTDDKKTELVGESWIDLKAIVVPGGGQKDLWQTLTARGKYAGEIRLEITYYDSRTKPEKAVTQVQQSNTAADLESGSVRQRTPKRRPLPSDPVTGEAPRAPSPVPASTVTPAAPQVSTPLSNYQHATPSRVHHRGSSHADVIPNQSPLQSLEYSTPPSHGPSRRQTFDHYSPSPQQPPPQSYPDQPRPDMRPSRTHREHYESPSHHPSGRSYDDRDYRSGAPRNDQPDYHAQSPDPQDFYDSSPRQQNAGARRPPPPPAHRSSHASPSHDTTPGGSFDLTPSRSAAPPMRQDVLRNEAHRTSQPSYPGRTNFQHHSSSSSAIKHTAADPYDQSMPRHYSENDIDSRYHHRSMQPTVEDAPETPPSHNPASYGYPRSRESPYDNHAVYEKAPSPAPLALSRSAGGSPRYEDPMPAHRYGYKEDPFVHPHSAPPAHVADGGAYSNPSRQVVNYGSPRHESYDERSYQAPPSAVYGGSPSYTLPTLPSSLVPGVDPALSQEISGQIHEETLRDGGKYNVASMMTAPRGREVMGSSMDGSSPVGARRDYAQPHSPGGSYTPEYAGYATARQTREVSPNPQHTIRRKSVSPAPPPGGSRRESDVPFGPDAYDSWNPVVAASREASPADPNAKIISHDGREIDPSDHLPMSSWAPEPEPKQHQEPVPEPRSRPSPAGAQPMPPSTRRPLRVIARPQSSALEFSGPQTPPAPSSGGRQRLVKKSRHSATPSHGASSPLAPVTPDKYKENSSPYTPTRGHGRHNTWDHQNENRNPHYEAGPPIPAKIPLMRGANGGVDYGLAEEMSRIDIGQGRSRRRGGY